MSNKRLGTITIGQAPRTDITPILAAHIANDVECIHLGVLDNFDKQTINNRFKPQHGEAILTTRLLDNTSVILGKTEVQKCLQHKIDELQQKNCSIIALLCTGEFHGLTCKKSLLIEPDRVIPPTISAIIGNRKLGIIVPLKEQINSEAAKWQGLKQPPCFSVSSPYIGTEKTLTEATEELLKQHVDLIILDCMGFTYIHQTIVKQLSGNVPVVLSNALLARLLAELM